VARLSEHAIAGAGLGIGCWMLDVGCWMLDVWTRAPRPLRLHLIDALL
jgi:hypothetical protein